MKRDPTDMSGPSDQPWPWDDEKVRAAHAGVRRRRIWPVAVASAVMLYVLVHGLFLYGRLPQRIPLDLEGPSPTAMRQTSSLPKNPLTVFGMLLFGAVFMVMAIKVEAKRDYSRWPGWERTQLLTPERRGYLLLPVRESFYWIGATVAIGMALVQLAVRDVALRQGTLLGFWPFVAAVALCFVEGITGGIIANRRGKAALG